MIERVKKTIPNNAKWFDIIETGGESTPITFKNNKIYSILERENSGIGVRVNINGKTGFSYTNDESNISNTVQKAVSLAQYSENENFDLPLSNQVTFEPYSKKEKNFSIKEQIEYAKESISKIEKIHPSINIDLSINRSTGFTKILNSNNLNMNYKNSYYSASISTTLVSDDGTKIDAWESISSQEPVSFDHLSDKILKTIKIASTPAKLSSGKIPLLLTPRGFSSLIGIVAGGLNGASIYKGISPFVGKIGEKFFNEKFSLIDDPTIQDSPFSFPFDDEGVLSSKKDLIKNGVLNKYITNLKYAEKLKIEPTGNGSRGYASSPVASFSNILVPGGNESFENLIKSIKKGIIADRFIGLGQSNTLTGDFSANLDMGFLIENGKIIGRVKDCMISDNLFSILKGEMELSKEIFKVGSAKIPYAYFPSVNYTG